MLTHAPTCEVNRGGDHGPCSCGYERERAKRLASMTSGEIVSTIAAWMGASDGGRRDAALRLAGEVGEAIRSMERQRDALRKAAEKVIAICDHPSDCCCCGPLRAALEVR